MDKDLIKDSSQGFTALASMRLYRIHEFFKDVNARARLLILAIALAPIRYVGNFLAASVTSVRIKRAKKLGTQRPPLLDLTNPSRSPVQICLQFYASLVSAPNDAGICILLSKLAEETAFDGGWTLEKMKDQLRIAAVVSSLTMHWRHVKRFLDPPHVLAVTIDPLQPLGRRHAVQMRFLHGSDCCRGFTWNELAKHIHIEDVPAFGRWTPEVEEKLWCLFDCIDMSTIDTEGVHAAQQKLVSGVGGGNRVSTFLSKCVNRNFSSVFESSSLRNFTSTGPLAIADTNDKKQDAPTMRGGVSAKSMLMTKVRVETKCGIAEAWTRAKRDWEHMSSDEQGRWEGMARAARRESQRNKKMKFCAQQEETARALLDGGAPAAALPAAVPALPPPPDPDEIARKMPLGLATWYSSPLRDTKKTEIPVAVVPNAILDESVKASKEQVGNLPLVPVNFEKANAVMQNEFGGSLHKSEEAFSDMVSKGVRDADDFPHPLVYPMQCSCYCSRYALREITWRGWSLFTSFLTALKRGVTVLGGADSAHKLRILVALEVVTPWSSYTRYALLGGLRESPKHVLAVEMIPIKKPRPHVADDEHVGVELKIEYNDYVETTRLDLPDCFRSALEIAPAGPMKCFHDDELGKSIVHSSPSRLASAIGIKALGFRWKVDVTDELVITHINDTFSAVCRSKPWNPRRRQTASPDDVDFSAAFAGGGNGVADAGADAASDPHVELGALMLEYGSHVVDEDESSAVLLSSVLDDGATDPKVKREVLSLLREGERLAALDSRADADYEDSVAAAAHPQPTTPSGASHSSTPSEASKSDVGLVRIYTTKDDGLTKDKLGISCANPDDPAGPLRCLGKIDAIGPTYLKATCRTHSTAGFRCHIMIPYAHSFSGCTTALEVWLRRGLLFANGADHKDEGVRVRPLLIREWQNQ